MRVAGVVRKPSFASYPPLPLGQGGDTYFDDNTWVALDLVQAHRMRVAGLMRGREVVLERARALFELVAAGWCRDPRPYPGGVYWVDAAWNRDRGAAVTAGLAVLALHLHDLTTPETFPDSEVESAATRARYLDVALTAYRWLRDTLWIADGSEAGLYHDKVLGDGGIDGSQWIYNQGVAIAAGVMLHRMTGEAAYLEQARATADAALAWYGAQRVPAGSPPSSWRSSSATCSSSARLTGDAGVPVGDAGVRRPRLGRPRRSTTPRPTCSGSRGRRRRARCWTRRRWCRSSRCWPGRRSSTGCWREDSESTVRE